MNLAGFWRRVETTHHLGRAERGAPLVPVRILHCELDTGALVLAGVPGQPPDWMDAVRADGRWLLLGAHRQLPVLVRPLMAMEVDAAAKAYRARFLRHGQHLDIHCGEPGESGFAWWLMVDGRHVPVVRAQPT